MDLSGHYFMDGKDLWTAYNVFVESGSDEFLKYAAKKESITHDWMDSNGVDVDLSRVYLQERDITLRMAMIARSTEEFWAKYNGFIADLTQPGTRRFTVARFGDRSYNVFYKSCNDFTDFRTVREGTATRIACKFTLVLTEMNPQLDNELIHIVDEEGRHLVT